MWYLLGIELWCQMIWTLISFTLESVWVDGLVQASSGQSLESDAADIGADWSVLEAYL